MLQYTLSIYLATLMSNMQGGDSAFLTGGMDYSRGNKLDRPKGT